MWVCGSGRVDVKVHVGQVFVGREMLWNGRGRVSVESGKVVLAPPEGEVNTARPTIHSA